MFGYNLDYIMKNIGILLIALLFLGSCANNRHLRKRAKAQKKILDISLEYPELFDTDTVYKIIEEVVSVPVESIIFDTIVRNTSDTIVIENDRIKTVIKPMIDVRTKEVKWRVRTKIKADTLYITDIDTIKTIHTEIETKTVTKKVKFIPWLIWLIGGLLVALVLFLLYLLYKAFLKYGNHAEKV